MKYFTQLNYPEYDLKTELYNLLDNNKITWHHGQICITGVEDDPDNQSIGCGSLYYDWDNSYYDDQNNFVLPKRKKIYKETDFKILNSAFRGTLFENVHNMLTEKHTVGRIRLMKSKLKTCLSWHTDDSTRIHYPIVTQPGCMMVIEDEVMHMPTNTWWHTDTTKEHTAFNGSKEDRIHLVVCLT
jgi:hypothetical protein